MDPEIVPTVQAHCICCERLIEPACKAESEEEYTYLSWEMPSDGVSMDGGGSFGSALYDSLMDGIGIEMVICDGCIEKGIKKGFIRETKVPTFSERALSKNKECETMIGVADKEKEIEG